MLCLKLDGRSIPWIVVFLPVLIFQFFIFLLHFIGLKTLEHTIKEQENKRRKQNLRKKKEEDEDEDGNDIENNRAHSNNNKTRRGADMSDEEGSDSDGGGDDGGGDDQFLTDQWERQHALRSTRNGFIVSGLSFLWQLLLALKLQWNDMISLSYGEILLPLLLGEFYSAYGGYYLAKSARKAVDDMLSGTSEEDNAKRLLRSNVAQSSQKSIYNHLLRASFVVFLIFRVSGETQK
jgi:hypothetical protein